jgi:hypothetical protein
MREADSGKKLIRSSRWAFRIDQGEVVARDDLARIAEAHFEGR